MIRPDEAQVALETTLETMELRADAAALVAAMRIVASALDLAEDAEEVAKLANVQMRQLAELRTYCANPDFEDPFEALARSLSSAEGSQ